MPADELRQTLAVYLALDRARMIRRALVNSFGVLAGIAGWLMTIAHLFSPVARIATIGLCVMPAVGAWIAELGLQRRLFRRLERAGRLRWPEPDPAVRKS